MSAETDPQSTDPQSPAPRPSALPGTADAEGWRRLHPLSPLLQGGLFLLVIIGIVIANLRDSLIGIFVPEYAADDVGDYDDLFAYIAAEGLIIAVIGGLVGVILLVVFFAWLSWRFYTYRITDEAVEARKGVLFKQHRRAPLERIQSVNLQRPLLARALGLTKIEIQTAGQDGKVDLSYLGHRDAKTVREQILRSAALARGIVPRGEDPREAAPAGPAGAEGADSTTAVGYDGTAYAPAVGTLAQRAQDFADFDIDPSARASGALVSVPVGRLLGSMALSWNMIVFVVLFVGVPIAATIWSWAILAGLIPAVLVMISVAFGHFNRGFNFTLSRTADGIRTGSGLTSTTTDSIPLGRIHAVEAIQPLPWRMLGWWSVRITTAGYSAAQAGQNQLRNTVLPVGREDDVLRVLEALLPSIAAEPDDIDALRDALVGDGSGYLGAGPRAGWVLWFGRKRAGIRIEGSERAEENATLRIRRGAMFRRLLVMPILRAQSVQLRRPLVHRMLGLASIQAHTVLGPVQVEMRGLELGRARQVFELLADTVVRVQSGEADRRAESRTRRSETAAEPVHVDGVELAAAGPAGPAEPEPEPAPAPDPAPQPEPAPDPAPEPAPEPRTEPENAEPEPAPEVPPAPAPRRGRYGRYAEDADPTHADEPAPRADSGPERDDR